MRLVLGQGARFVAAGLVLGIVFAIGAMRMLASLLFGLSATDPATFAQVGTLVAVVAMLACAAPSLRVSHHRIDMPGAD